MNSDKFYSSLTDDHMVSQLCKMLGWESFLSWESYQRKYGEAEYGIALGKPLLTTPTPVAFCSYGEWRVFSPDHQQLDEFDFLHSLGSAWKIVDYMAKAPETPTKASKERRKRFVAWFKSAKLWACSEQEAAFVICESALHIHTNTSHLDEQA